MGAEKNIAKQLPALPGKFFSFFRKKSAEMINEININRAELNLRSKSLEQSKERMEGLEQEYNDLFVTAPVAMFLVDNAGMIINANHAAAVLLGRQASALIKTSLFRYIAPDQIEYFKTFLARARKNKHAPQIEIKLLKEDKTERLVRLESQLFYDLDKGVAGLQLAAVDIHKQTVLKTELEKSLKKYRHLVRNAPAGIYEIDFERMRFISANEAACNMTGYSMDEMSALNPMDFLTPESRRRFLQRLQKIQKGEEPPKNVEFEIYKKNGGTLWVLLNVSYNKQDEKISTATVVIQDIDALKKLEAALLKSEKRFRTLADNIPDIIVRFDENLRHNYVNPVISRITGIPRLDFIGKTNKELGMPAALCKKWDRFLRRILKTGNPGQLQFEFTGLGRSYFFETRAIPEFSDQGEIKSIIAVTRDITHIHSYSVERKELYRELAKERAQLDAVISQAPEGIVVTDEKARIIRTNATAERLYGRPVPVGRSVESHTVFELCDKTGHPIKPESLPLTRSALYGKYVTNEEIIIKYPESQKLLLVNTAPIKNEQGKITGAVGIFQDISNRAQQYLQDKTNATQKYARNILNTLGDPILLVDNDFSIVWVNEAFNRCFRTDLQSLAGRRFFNLAGGQWDIPELRGLFSNVLDRHAVISEYVLEWLDKSSGHRSFNLYAQRMYGITTDGPKIVVSLKEITRQISKEKERLIYQQKLRDLSIQLTQSEENERSRIATGLHDGAVQVLTASRIQLALARKNKSPEKTGAVLKEIEKNINDVIDEIRHLSFELSTPMLTTSGLGAAVKWYASKFQKENGIKIKVKDDGSKIVLSDYLQTFLFQAVRELLQNVLKHARAKQVSIAIAKSDDDDLVEIEFKDDGVGFDTSDLFDAIRQAHGFGLFNIRERLDALNGKLLLESEQGKGTRIVIKAPLEKAERGQNAG